MRGPEFPKRHSWGLCPRRTSATKAPHGKYLVSNGSRAFLEVGLPVFQPLGTSSANLIRKEEGETQTTERTMIVAIRARGSSAITLFLDWFSPNHRREHPNMCMERHTRTDLQKCHGAVQGKGSEWCCWRELKSSLDNQQPMFLKRNASPCTSAMYQHIVPLSRSFRFLDNMLFSKGFPELRLDDIHWVHVLLIEAFCGSIVRTMVGSVQRHKFRICAS